jgi:hypothetical protein
MSTVYIVQIIVPSLSDFDVSVYESETEAYQIAVDEAIAHLESYDTLDKNFPLVYWEETLDKIKLYFSQGKYQEALSTHIKWMDDMSDDFDSIVNIDVLEKEIRISNISTNKSTFNISSIKCKCCNTMLNAGETPCWKCGTEDPTN